MRCMLKLRRNVFPSFLLLIFLIFIDYAAMAQATRTISGKVVNSTTGEPVAGASIRAKGIPGGTTTDSSGTFRWTVPASARTLLISSVGFQETQAAIGASVPISVQLVATGKDLGEVVVVGYGTQKRATLTGAVATVDAKVFKDRGVVSNPLAS